MQHGSDLEAQVRAELELIMPLVSALTGLPTHWSGVVELVEGAEFKGEKRFTCDIQIRVDLAEQDVRWTTLIHESLHAVSVGYSPTQYQILPGWEEGTVERLQRLLRGNVLAQMGITLSDPVLAHLDADHRYNGYVRALEAIRLSLGASAARRTRNDFRRECGTETEDLKQALVPARRTIWTIWMILNVSF